MKQHSESGFTLLEVLIAITVLAFLMLGVYTIVSNSVDTKDRVLTEDRSYVQVMRALDRLQSDIAQAWSPLYAHAKYNETAERARARSSGQEFKPLPFKSTDRFPFQSVTFQPAPAIEFNGLSDLAFFTAANRRKLQDSKQSRYAWVRHSLRRSEDQDENGNQVSESEWVRTFQNEDLWSESFNWDDERATTQLLLKGIKTLEFRFWDQRTEKYVERITDSSDPDILRSVQVTLVWVNSDGNEQTFVRVMRPLWPFFDTKKDEEQKELARKEKGNGGIAGGSQPQGGDTGGDNE